MKWISPNRLAWQLWTACQDGQELHQWWIHFTEEDVKHYLHQNKDTNPKKSSQVAVIVCSFLTFIQVGVMRDNVCQLCSDIRVVTVKSGLSVCVWTILGCIGCMYVFLVWIGCPEAQLTIQQILLMSGSSYIVLRWYQDSVAAFVWTYKHCVWFDTVCQSP